MTQEVVMMGLGYIGLPTAALISSKGIKVLGVDVKPEVVETINQGKIHIVEPDLEGLVYHGIKTGYLKADTQPSKANTFIVAVPTPFQNNYQPDISFVKAATEMALPYLEEGNLFIIESTSPVGTTEKIADFIFSQRPELKGKIYIAYCPERVLPGKIIYELERNDRSVGGIDAKSTQKAIEFYKKFVKGDILPTNARTAEMCKLVENSYRDTNIAFANELSMICEKADINVWELIELANHHPRVNILQPGAGVGGHCIAVDPWFIVHDFPEESRIIKTSREVNNYKTQWIVERISNQALKFEMQNKRKPIIGCMGLAFKPNIDDLRESPAFHIAQELDKEHNVLFVEPNVDNLEKYPLTETNEALNKSDIIVFLVAHDHFKQVAADVQANEQKQVFDFCGLLK